MRCNKQCVCVCERGRTYLLSGVDNFLTGIRMGWDSVGH